MPSRVASVTAVPFRPAARTGALAPQFTKRLQPAEDEAELHVLMGEEITKIGKASASRFVVANAQVNVVVADSGTGKAQVARIGKRLPNDRLDLTVVVNVDGRRGLAQAKAWAKTDTYEIEIRHPSGKRDRLSGLPAQGLVSSFDLSVRLESGKTEITAWPTQSSAGVGGYVEGRKLELTYAPAVQRRPA